MRIGSTLLVTALALVVLAHRPESPGRFSDTPEHPFPQAAMRCLLEASADVLAPPRSGPSARPWRRPWAWLGSTSEANILNGKIVKSALVSGFLGLAARL